MTTDNSIAIGVVAIGGLYFDEAGATLPDGANGGTAAAHQCDIPQRLQ
jgi:hypothetical protein